MQHKDSKKNYCSSMYNIDNCISKNDIFLFTFAEESPAKVCVCKMSVES
jgi:hypothetical protein